MTDPARLEALAIWDREIAAAIPIGLIVAAVDPRPRAPLREPCELCEGTGKLGFDRIGPEEYRRVDDCYLCHGMKYHTVRCEECWTAPAVGRDQNGDALCDECAEKLGVALEVV